MMIFLSLRVIADAEGGLKNRAHLRPVLQGFGGGQPPTSTPRYIPRHCLLLLAAACCYWSNTVTNQNDCQNIDRR